MNRSRGRAIGRPVATLAVVVAIAVLAACSSSKSAAPPADTTPVDGATPAATRPACERPAEATPAATPVPGVPSDWDVTTFDGVKIRTHWFPVSSATPSDPAPTVLMGPGWGQAGDTNVDSIGFLGALNIASLQSAGYNVLTWDPRGWGQSGGTVESDSPDYEGKDVQQLLDWVAAKDGVQLDGAGDPRVGMVGGSYGGGIQLVTAAIDCRVDAIVPIVAWHSLQTSLFKADTVKSGWSNLLFAATAGHSVDPHITSAYASGTATGTLSDEDKAWFIDRGPGDLVSDITIPTLIVQGTVDTLFTLDEGVTNYELLEAAGTPVSMLWFCGGHGACLTNPGDETRVGTAAIAWLSRYVKDDPSVRHGRPLRLHRPERRRPPGRRLAPRRRPGHHRHGSGHARPHRPRAGPAPSRSRPEAASSTRSSVPSRRPRRPTRSTSRSRSPTRPSSSGAPELTISYSGTVPDGDRPTRVFAQLVDDATGFVLGNQITPIEVTLDGQTHTTTVPLEIVAHAATAGQHLTLQLVATTVAYAQPRVGGSITFDQISISLPTVTGTS